VLWLLPQAKANLSALLGVVLATTLKAKSIQIPSDIKN